MFIKFLKNVLALLFFGYKNKGKYQIYVSKNTFKRHVDLLLIREEGKRHFVLIKKSKTFMHDHILHHGRKHFCRYCLKAFSAAEILKNHFNNIFKINGKRFVNDYAYGDAKVKDHYHVSLGNMEALHIGIVISRLN